MTRLIDVDGLKNKFWHGDLVPNKEMYHISEIMYAIDNAPTVSKKELEKIFYETAEKPELKEVLAYECGKNERPQGEWISVSERLPKFSGLYLISIDSLVTVMNFSGTHFTNRGGVRVEVDAWQPLPEPYNEGGRQ